jgi:uncharacterized protein
VRPVATFPGANRSGSGFVVAHEGYVLTNRHVVGGCSEVSVRTDTTRWPAATVAVDSSTDLALLKTSAPLPVAASFRSGVPLRPGDDVVAVGFPLSGLLADQVNVTTGSVSALAGLYNNAQQLQMSAPVQPGSSGGPLFDDSGNVVGVVVNKLNAKAVAEAMGDVPQNVNFAVKGSVAETFLAAHGVRYATARSDQRRSNADVGDVGREVTVLVECYK